MHYVILYSVPSPSLHENLDFNTFIKTKFFRRGTGKKQKLSFKNKQDITYKPNATKPRYQNVLAFV